MNATPLSNRGAASSRSSLTNTSAGHGSSVHHIVIIPNYKEATETLRETLDNLAAQYQMTPENLKKRMEMTGSLGQLVSNINYNKTVDWLYGQARVNVQIEVPDSGSGSGSDEPDGS